MRFKNGILCALALVLAAAPRALAKDKTAFELIREGDRYIGEQSRDKVVQIRSERSAGSLTPARCVAMSATR